MPNTLKNIIVLVLSLSFNTASSNYSPRVRRQAETVSIKRITHKFTNVYVLQVADTIILIDSGLPNKTPNLLSNLKKLNVEPSNIDILLLTHAHPDHAGNAHYLQKEYGVEVVAGAGDTPLIKTNGRDAHLCPTGFLGKVVQKTIASDTYRTFVPDLLIHEPYNLVKSGMDIQIIPVPGHTEGSLAIRIGSALFVGDIIRGQWLNKKKPTRHIFVCDYAQNLSNIKKLAQLKGVEKWYPGHGGPLKIKHIKKFIRKEE